MHMARFLFSLSAPGRLKKTCIPRARLQAGPPVESAWIQRVTDSRCFLSEMKFSFPAGSVEPTGDVVISSTSTLVLWNSILPSKARLSSHLYNTSALGEAIVSRHHQVYGLFYLRASFRGSLG